MRRTPSATAPVAWWARGAIAVLSLLVSLAVLEVAVRVIDPLGVSYYEASKRYHLDKRADPDLVFRHAPSWQTRYGEVPVTYNDRGLRDRPVPDKADDEYRVLALGDSVTFGWGVPREEIFTARLEALLGARLARPVRVINGGVGGYNTVQEVAYFRRDGMALQPDLVILTYVENDTEVNVGPFDPWSAVAGSGRPPLDAALVLLGRSWLYRLANYVYQYALPQRVPHAVSSPGDDLGWRASMSALRELAARCDAQRIPLMIFFFRWGTRGARPLYEDVMRNAAGHPVRDIWQWFRGRDVRALMNSRIDTHPNAEGHRLIAEGMAREIADHVGTASVPVR